MTTSTTPTILITGATGNVGTELTKYLASRQIPFRVMVRTPQNVETVAAIDGAEAVIGDFNDATSVAAALNGMERVFLLTNSSAQAETQQTTFVEQARRAGVTHLVKLSQWAADIDSSVRFLRYHAAVEKVIKRSGLAYTFLRPNLFMQGLLGFKEPILKQGKLFAPVGNSKISVVDVRDIARVLAAALTEEGHEGKTYNLTGAEALSHQEMCDKLSATLNRPIQFVDVSPAEMRKALAGIGFPEWQADGLIEDYAHYQRGEAVSVTSDIENVTGRPPHSFAEFARDYAPAFS